jgi:hypothetical protein
VVVVDEHLSRDEVRERIKKEWGLGTDDGDDIDDAIAQLEARGDIIIASTQEWYYPDGKFDAERVRAKWQSTVEGALARGKKGLRAFGDVSGLLRNGYAKELVECERTLEKRYDQLAFTVICGYPAELAASKLEAGQLDSLHLSHEAYRNLYNVLENPMPHQHIALVYETSDQRDAASVRYINEGLKRGQLCVYASIHLRDSGHAARISKMIVDYDKNVREGNLVVVDLSSYYISALSDELQPFEEIRKDLAHRVDGRAGDKHVRLVGDVVDLLFRNRHFDECTRLEAWWHQKSFPGSYLCPYPKDLLNRFPYDVHKFRVFARHDVVADAGGHVMAAYVLENKTGAGVKQGGGEKPVTQEREAKVEAREGGAKAN